MEDYIILKIDDDCFGIGYPEELDYWHTYDFSIMLVGEDEKNVKVGHMRVLKLNWGSAQRNGVSLYDAFDAHSIETAQCYDVVFDDKGDVRKKFQDERYGLLDWLGNDFHFLESITIDETCHGRGLVAKATAVYLENFANSSDVVYFKGFPLQYDSSGRIGPISRKFKGTFKTCQAKLCKYYESVGFRRIGKTEHFFFVVDDFLTKSDGGDE